MRPFGTTAVLLGASVASLIASRAVRRRSLSRLGAIAAWIVGFLSICTGLRGFVLLLFYQLGTMATKYRKGAKEARDATAAEGSVRGPSQVLACSAIAVACSLAHAILYGEEREIDFVSYPAQSSLACAILAHHATCLADTLASEFGILAAQAPILVTRPLGGTVPPGTNGGITWAGTAWSIVGGAAMAFGTILMDVLSGVRVGTPMAVIRYGSICGLVGSFVDSVLGATLQATYYDHDEQRVVSNRPSGGGGGRQGPCPPPSVKLICGANILTNVQVNLVSAMTTCVLGAFVIGPMVFGMTQS